MIRRLLVLSGISIVGVILFHAAGWGFVAMFAWQDRYAEARGFTLDQATGLDYYFLRFVEQLAVFVIPAFMFVSGFFIATATGRTQKNVNWNVIFSRIKHLIVPYLLWSTLLIVLLLLQGKVFSPRQYVVMYLTGGANPAYYYVPLLTQLLLLSPLLVPAARARWAILLIVTGLVQLAVQLTYYPGLVGVDLAVLRSTTEAVPKWAFPTRIFWFSLGIAVGFHVSGFRQFVSRWKWPLLAITLILIPVGMLEWEWIVHAHGSEWLGHRETLLDSVYSLTAILTFLAFSDVSIPFSATFSVLAAQSFGIYLIHSPAMEYFARTLYHFAPWVLGQQWLLQPLLWLVGLGVPLLLMAVVRKSPLRGQYRWIFG